MFSRDIVGEGHDDHGPDEELDWKLAANLNVCLIALLIPFKPRLPSHSRGWRAGSRQDAAVAGMKAPSSFHS